MIDDTTIPVATIAAAERIAGIEYAPAERELMHDNLAGQIAEAQARRRLIFANEAPPASRFDPRLPGFPPLPPQRPLRPSNAAPGALPDDDDDIAFAAMGRLSQWIAAGTLTSRRLTEIYLARIARHAAALECFVTVTADLALAQADAADALVRAGTWLGPLHGIPYGLKDLFDTKGIRTSWGATPFKDRVPDRDAAVVERLRAAGAVLLGKTTVGALAYGDIWFGGKTRNPWNLNEGSSGSSAGSAAAVAAGLCGFAIGTETLGSITSPSQRCGTTGLRPTFGRVSRRGAMALCPSLDKVGPICRSVEDCALVLAAINGEDPADRGSIGTPFNFDAAAGIAGLRLGFLPTAFADDAATDVDRAALTAAKSLGIPVIEVGLPELPYGALMAILYAEAAASFEELTLSNRDDELVWQQKNAWPNAFRKARFLSAVDHVQADRLRYRVMQELDALFRQVDVLIGPFMTGPMLVASNFTGHPCLHLRAGFRRVGTRADPSLAEGRLEPGKESETARLFEAPQGISLWAGLFDEGRLCNLGMALEGMLGVAERRPTFAI
jgi:Asp-tRNA(Asn)/Glu-tRNA(Gln) amidotransferase A subunit family amidase